MHNMPMGEKCYIVGLNNIPSEQLTAAIKSYGTWAKITDTVWAVTTKKTAAEVRDHLSEKITTGGRIIVIKSGVEAAWKNVHCTNEWLKTNL